jgi:anti-sigma-K factor RskA
MNCARNSKEREIVFDYCAGALDAARAAEFERHMEQCGDCLRAVAEQRQVWEALDHWTAPAVSGDFNARLYARIATEETAPAWQKWLRSIFPPASPAGFWKPAVSLAAACAVLTIGLMVHGPKPAPDSAPIQPEQFATQPAQVATHVDIEQVANALDELDVLAPASM